MSQVLVVGGYDVGSFDRTVVALRELQPNNEYKFVFIEELNSLDEVQKINFDVYLTSWPDLPEFDVVKPKQNRGPERSRNARKVW